MAKHEHFSASHTRVISKHPIDPDTSQLAIGSRNVLLFLSGKAVKYGPNDVIVLCGRAGEQVND